MSDTTPLDDIAFLARSDHRVTVLRTLASGARTRPDLHQETEIPQPTLGRILDDFVDRHWVEHRRPEYALTASGTLVVDQFEDLLETVATVQQLGAVIQQLPTEEMDIDIREFADAAVTTPRDGDALRHVRRLEELLYSADHVRNLVTSVGPGSSDDNENRMEEFFEGDQQVEAIIPVSVLQVVADEEMTHYFEDAIELPRLDLYLYEGTPPYMLALVDGTAVLVPTDEQGTPTAIIETDNETILSWVDAELNEYRAQSTKVTADDLPQ